MPLSHQFRPLLRAPSTIHPRLGGIGLRHHHRTSVLQQPYKDDQDRESLKPRSQEYSKSDGDDKAATHSEAAFDPNTTDPAKAKDTAAKGGAGNPLEVSPANKDISKPKAGKQGVEGGDDTSDKQRRSRAGNPQKNG